MGRQMLWIGLVAGLAVAAPSGHIAYQRDGKAWVLDLAGGQPVELPNSGDALELVMSPATGEAFYVAGGKAWRCAPPYRAAQVWQSVPAGAYPTLVSTDGKHVFLSAEEGGGRYDVASGGYTPLPFGPMTCDATGGLVCYQGEKTIEFNRPATGETKVIFSIGRPQPLFDALKKAKWPAKLKALTDAIDPELYKDQYNWGFGPPALTPDGERVFFAVNAGVGLGATGNTSWCLVVATVADGALLPLSKLGCHEFGRLPHILEVSPDSRRLLMVTSFHNNAVENPCQAYVIDLHTQEAKELLWSDKRLEATPNLVNVTSGACWSPDGKYVAVSAAYYDGVAAIQAQDFELKDANFVLTIYDAVTGEVVRQLPGLQQPVWGK